MRRLHLRGRDNILKRLLIHLCGFNLSLIMRKQNGRGTPRDWQGYSVDEYLTFLRLWIMLFKQHEHLSASETEQRPNPSRHTGPWTQARNLLLPRTARFSRCEQNGTDSRYPMIVLSP
jgi:hypothetical protein